MKRMPNYRQQGVSLSGLIIVLIFLAMLAVVGMKVVPSIIEYQAIKKAVTSAKQSGTTAREIQSAFDRQAQIDDITSVTGKDLDISKAGSGYEVSFSYPKVIPLVGPVSILIEYAGSTSRSGPAKRAE